MTGNREEGKKKGKYYTVSVVSDSLSARVRHLLRLSVLGLMSSMAIISSSAAEVVLALASRHTSPSVDEDDLRRELTAAAAAVAALLLTCSLDPVPRSGTASPGMEVRCSGL